MKIVICADGPVGLTLINSLLRVHRGSIVAVITVSRNQIYESCRVSDIPVFSLDSGSLSEILVQKVGKFDIGLLLWWPSIIRNNVISLAKYGFINTHPSLLPLHRGKHPNFWAMKEGEPFGVSLHFIGNGIDDGDIIAQSELEYGWEDNGGTLYRRSLDAMVKLVEDTFPSIAAGSILRRKQLLESGSFHYGRELEDASLIDLDCRYKARDLINLLRARTFNDHPACRFEDQGGVYEIRVSIKKLD